MKTARQTDPETVQMTSWPVMLMGTVSPTLKNSHSAGARARSLYQNGGEGGDDWNIPQLEGVKRVSQIGATHVSFSHGQLTDETVR